MTGTVPLNVKWGKEEITFDFVVAGGVKGLKTELEEKTRVPADRMKIMAKSKGKLMMCRRVWWNAYIAHAILCRTLEGRFEG